MIGNTNSRLLLSTINQKLAIKGTGKFNNKIIADTPLIAERIKINIRTVLPIG